MLVASGPVAVRAAAVNLDLDAACAAHGADGAGLVGDVLAVGHGWPSNTLSARFRSR